MHIAHHADNLRGPRVAAANQQTLTHRVEAAWVSRPELTRQILIDNRHPLRIFAILRTEIAAAPQRNFQRSEVSGRDVGDFLNRALVQFQRRLRGVLYGGSRLGHHRQNSGRHSALDARQGCHSLDEVLVKGSSLLVCVIAQGGKSNAQG